MIEGLFSNTNYVAAKQMMDGTMVRHEAITANLANVETPGYKRIDVSPAFQSQLQQAIASGSNASIQAVKPVLQVDTTAVALRPDGNTVQLESEMLHLNQNAAEHAVELQMITGNLLRMRLALTGKG